MVDRLLSDGFDVRVLDNFAPGRRENLLDVLADVEVVEGDIQSYEGVSNAVKGCGGDRTLNVLRAARDAGVGRVIYASSSSIYGANPEVLPKHEGLVLQPISPYAVAKLAEEAFCRSYPRGVGLETVALRYFNVFGPRQDPLSQYAAVVPRFITALIDGRPPSVFGDGEQTRDFTYVGNVVDGTVLAMTAEGAAGKVFNVAAGSRTSLNELLRTLRAPRRP